MPRTVVSSSNWNCPSLSEGPRTSLQKITLLRRIQRVCALFVEFVLQFETHVVGFDGDDDFANRIDPPFHLVFPQLTGCGRALAGIVIGKACIPPDSGVDALRQVHAMLVGARFAGRSVLV